jgi:hypothetical protein
VPLPPRPANPAPPTPPAADEGAALPDWLRELRSTVSSEPPPAGDANAADEADWLAGAGAGPASDAGAAPEQPMPDWLRELSTSIPEAEAAQPAPPPRAPAPRIEGATSWLSSMGQAPETPPAETPPAPPEPRPASRPLKRMPSGATDWLRSIGQEPDPQAPPTPPAEPPAEPPRQASEPQPADDGIPSWLSDISEEELARDLATSAEEPSSPASDVADSATPSWISPGEKADDTASDSAMPSWLSAGDEAEEAASERGESAIPLWLRDEGSVGADTRLTADQDEDDGDVSVPDWLRLVRDDETTANLPDEASDAPIPSWLQTASDRPDEPATRARPQGAASEQPQSDEPAIPAWLQGADATSDEEAPLWLRDSAGDAPIEAPGAASAPPQPYFPPSAPADAGANTSEDDNLPGWLRADEAPSAAQATPGDDQPVPDWLRTDVPSQGDDKATPSWMQGLEPEVPSAAPPADTDDVPPWLQGSDDEPPLGAPPVPGDANLPAWLRGADERPSQPAAPAMPPAAPTQPAAPNDAAGLPPWLQEADAEEASAAPAAPETKSDSGDFLGGSDLPGWLRPQEAEGAPPPAEAAPRSSDWLDRLRAQEAEAEAEGLEGEAAAATATIARPSFSRTPAQLEAIGVLQRLVATPFPEPVAKPVAEPQPAWRRVRAEQLLYLLLLLALLAGLLVPTLSAPFAGASGTTEAAAIVAANDQLNDRSRVLVAYEWDARRRSELAPLEQTVINHLAQRSVKFVFVSTDVQGTLLSFDARNRLLDPANGYNYLPGGRDYILLGYRPGGELALRSLAQDLPGVLRSDFQGQDANQSAVASDVQTGQPLLTDLNDFAQIVVMADDPQDVQAWMEQVHSQAPGVPVLLLLPEETTPIVQPYLRQQNIFYLAGTSDALAYSLARGGEGAAAAAATSGQLSYAVAAFVALALVGALVGALARRRGAA